MKEPRRRHRRSPSAIAAVDVRPSRPATADRRLRRSVNRTARPRPRRQLAGGGCAGSQCLGHLAEADPEPVVQHERHLADRESAVPAPPSRRTARLRRPPRRPAGRNPLPGRPQPVTTGSAASCRDVGLAPVRSAERSRSRPSRLTTVVTHARRSAMSSRRRPVPPAQPGVLHDVLGVGVRATVSR